MRRFEIRRENDSLSRWQATVTIGEVALIVIAAVLIWAKLDGWG